MSLMGSFISATSADGFLATEHFPNHNPSSIHQWRFHAQLLGRKNVLDRGRNWEDEGIQDRERRRGSCWTQECQSACLTSLSKIHLKTGTTSMSIPAWWPAKKRSLRV